jgi:hypothetical protein
MMRPRGENSLVLVLAGELWVAVVIVVLVVFVVVADGEEQERADGGGGGCNERCSRFVNAREGENVWKMRTASSCASCG